VAAALVGTFLGILLCYGVIGPVAGNMTKASDAERSYYQPLRVVIVAFMKGSPPSLAVEYGPQHPRRCAAQLSRDGKVY
jgi:chemotaxis protein MotA